MRTAIIFTFCLLIGVVGQTLVKIGANRLDLTLQLLSLAFLKRNILMNWYLIVGLLCYALSMAVFVYILTIMDFSKAAPIMSLSYVFVLFIGYWFFQEHINLYRMLGVLAIVIGVFLVSRS